MSRDSISGNIPLQTSSESDSEVDEFSLLHLCLSCGQLSLSVSLSERISFSRNHRCLALKTGKNKYAVNANIIRKVVFIFNISCRTDSKINFYPP